MGSRLRRTLATTNAIESCLSTVRHVARNVQRWQGGDHIARWTAAGFLEAEKRFRRVKGYRQLAELAKKWNPGSFEQIRQSARLAADGQVPRPKAGVRVHGADPALGGARFARSCSLWKPSTPKRANQVHEQVIVPGAPRTRKGSPNLWSGAGPFEMRSGLRVCR